MPIKAGKLLTLEQGEYSDYSVLGFFVALQDFDPIALAKEYLASQPEESDSAESQVDEFAAMLIKRGLLLEVDYSAIYLGAGYGRLELGS